MVGTPPPGFQETTVTSPGCLTLPGTALLRVTPSQPETNSYYPSLTLCRQSPLQPGPSVTIVQSYHSFLVCSPLTPSLSHPQIWANKSLRDLSSRHETTCQITQVFCLPPFWFIFHGHLTVYDSEPQGSLRGTQHLPFGTLISPY